MDSLTLFGLFAVTAMLITYALFAMWTFHGMAVLSVLILRRKYPERARPYRMWGYPVTALLFVLFAFWFVINTLLTRPVSSSVSVAIMAAGVGFAMILGALGGFFPARSASKKEILTALREI